MESRLGRDRRRRPPRPGRFVDLPFRVKLLVLIGMAATVPLLFGGVFAYAYIARGATERAEADLLASLQKARLLVERREAEIDRVAKSIAGDNLVAINLGLSLDEAVRAHLSEARKDQSLDLLCVVDPEGRVRIDGGGSVDPGRLLESLGPYTLDAARMTGGIRFVALVAGGAEGGGASIVLGSAYPVRGSGKGTNCVMAGARIGPEPSPGGLLGSLREAAGLPVVAAANRGVIAYSDGDPSAVALPRPVYDSSSGELLSSGEVGGERFLFRLMGLMLSNGGRGWIGVGIWEGEAVATRDGAVAGFLAIMLAALALSWAVAALFSRRVTRPIVAMLGVARRIAEEDFDAEVPVESRDEIGTLAREFNVMSRRLKEGLSALYDEVGERRRAEAEVVALNEELEARIDARTTELSRANRELGQTIRDLEAARGQLVEAEKLAALGQLVASIAHEVNTPLGAIISSSESMAVCIGDILDGLPSFAASLSEEDRAALRALLGKAAESQPIEGPAARTRPPACLEESLARACVARPWDAADVLWQVGVGSPGEKELRALGGESGERILDIVEKASWLVRSRQIIAIAAEKAAKTIRALKSYARLDAGGETSEFDLRDEIDSILEIYYGRIKLGVEVRRDYREVEAVRGRRDSLSQVWFNLINNALQAMDYRGVLVVSVFPAEGGMTGASFTDDGPGIPEEHRSRVFEAFFTTKPRGEGSGLGLSISKKIVEEHGGRIFFESRPGRTTFTVLLPGVGRGGAPGRP